MKESIGRVGLAMAAAASVPNFLAGMLPSLMTIGRFAAEPDDLMKLRRGELIGSGLSLMTGAAASMVTNDPLPFIGTVIVLAILLFEYERAIRQAQSNPNLSTIDSQ
jgi:hypothetical protein